MIEFYAVSASHNGSGNNTETTVNDNTVLKNNEFKPQRNASLESSDDAVQIIQKK